MKKNQHDPISTIYMVTLGQRKIWHMTLRMIFYENYSFIETLTSTIYYDYLI